MRWRRRKRKTQSKANMQECMIARTLVAEPHLTMSSKMWSQCSPKRRPTRWCRGKPLIITTSLSLVIPKLRALKVLLQRSRHHRRYRKCLTLNHLLLKVRISLSCHFPQRRKNHQPLLQPWLCGHRRWTALRSSTHFNCLSLQAFRPTRQLFTRLKMY